VSKKCPKNPKPASFDGTKLHYIKEIKYLNKEVEKGAVWLRLK